MHQTLILNFRLSDFGALAAGVVLTLGLATSGAAEESDPGIELAFLNAVYEDLDSGLEPVEQGPLTIRFSSPEHRLQIFAHRLWVRPAIEGRYLIEAEVDFGGAGQLIADVEGGGISQRFQDLVTAPRQVVRVRGEVTALRRDDGYLLTMVSPNAVARVTIESGFAQQINTLCGAMALMPMLSFDCAPLTRSLERVGIPLPSAGTEFFVPDDWLMPDQREYLDGVLGFQ